MITGAIIIQEAINKIRERAQKEDLKSEKVKSEVKVISKYWKDELGEDFIRQLDTAIATNNVSEVIRLCNSNIEIINKGIKYHTSY